MRNKILHLAGASVAALLLGSCAYDSYHPANTRTAVSVGYGHGHGYGSNSFSTSFFWSTGDSRWGYDPYTRAYFDFNRRAYYDPWLYGYYPVGYRPPILVGVPHPVGYRQGWCPPPRRITNVTIVNYNERKRAYRNTNHGWARNVRVDSRHQTNRGSSNTRQQPATRPSGRDSRDNQWNRDTNRGGSRSPAINSGGRVNRGESTAPGGRPEGTNRRTTTESSDFRDRRVNSPPPPPPTGRPDRGNARPPERYNTPVDAGRVRGGGFQAAPPAAAPRRGGGDDRRASGRVPAQPAPPAVAPPARRDSQSRGGGEWSGGRQRSAPEARAASPAPAPRSTGAGRSGNVRGLGQGQEERGRGRGR